MNRTDILSQRLLRQQIIETKFKKPQELVSWMGAMQSQDFGMAKWAIGLRLKNLKEKDVDTAFNKGELLRTHVLRPTWHFVTPENIRWMLELTAPRVHAFSASMYRKVELDARFFKKCCKVIIKNLEGKRYLTRTALQHALKQSKINASGIRLSYIMMYAELEGIICSGPRIGKQFTYALIAERAPSAKKLPREEALRRLMLQYFRSRGPATLQDFSWWSGLTMKDARDGLHFIESKLQKETIDEKEYFFTNESKFSNPSSIIKSNQSTFLLPDYDEYGICYRDRSAIFDAPQKNPHPWENNIFNHIIIGDGRAIGLWQRSLSKRGADIKTTFFNPLNKRQENRLAKAIKRYQSFWKS